MPAFIAEFGGKYCEWSTVVDAPVSSLMSERALFKHLQDHYGSRGTGNFAEQMERVRKHGCSGIGWTKEDLLGCNRAGPDETELTEAEIIQRYASDDEPEDAAPECRLADALLEALHSSSNPVLQVLHMLLSEGVRESLNAELEAACLHGREGLVPGESSFDEFIRRIPYLTLGFNELTARDIRMRTLLCHSQGESLRFIFSNVVFPEFLKGDIPSKRVSHGPIQIVDATIVTTNGTQRIARQCEDLDKFGDEVAQVLANSDDGEEKLVSFTIHAHRDATPEELEACCWLNLTPDGKHEWLEGNQV